MPDEFVALREFDRFAESMRSEFKGLSDQMFQVSAKIDGLHQVRVEEARVMGEITSTISSINKRFDSHVASQDGEIANMKNELDNLWQEHANSAKNKLGWVGQFVQLTVAAIAGALISRAGK